MVPMRLAHGFAGTELHQGDIDLTGTGESPRRCCAMGAKAKGSKATRLSQYRWHFPERTLHIVDIENLAGAAIPTRIQVNEVQGRYLAKLGFGVADQAVLASSHLGLINAALGW